MSKFGSAIFNRLVIIIPYAWLTIFFLAPFFIVSEYRCRKPPSRCRLTCPSSIWRMASRASSSKIGQLSIRELRVSRRAMRSTPMPIFPACGLPSISTIVTLMIAYPIAYGMAKAPTSIRPTLLMLVILPFWTSFLIRVYAWIAILKPEGLLNQLLLTLGVIDSR